MKILLYISFLFLIYNCSLNPNSKYWTSKKNVAQDKDSKIKYVTNEHNGWVEGIQFSPDSSMFVTLCKDAQVRAFDTNTGELKYQKTFGGLFASKCTFSKTEKYL